MVDERVGPPPTPDEPLGVTLARLRKGAKLTGVQLGQLIDMSQAKISKIETGVVMPSAEDVRAIAEASGAAAEIVEQLVARAGRPRDAMTDYGRRDTVAWQRIIAEFEAETTTTRTFQPAILSGLLQTSEYARAVFTNVPAASQVAANGDSGISAAISLRMRRQEILADRTRRFHFIMPETLLESPLVDAVRMSDQLARIGEVARQENVTIGLIPIGTRLPYPPYHGFTLLDDDRVVVDLFNTVIISDGPADLRLYREVFEAFASVSTTDIEPVLDRYLRGYLERARSE